MLCGSLDGTGVPRVRLECNPEIPVAPGEEHWLLDTSLDEVYFPAVTREQSPAFLRNSNGRLDFPGPTQEAA